VEVRVAYDNIRRLHPGDYLFLNDQQRAIIQRVTHYADFPEMLAHEDPTEIAPDIEPQELLPAIRTIYPPEKEVLGAVALELALPRYDAVLFDMGYTLVYFDPAQELIAQNALRAAGAARSVDEINTAVQKVWGAYYRDAATAAFPATEEYDRRSQAGLERGLLTELGLEADEHTLQLYSTAIQRAYSRDGVIRPYVEVEDVLTTLQSLGYRLGIVSNWSWDLRHRVRQAGLDGYFEIVWASAYAGCNKPHPGIFHQVLAQLNVAPTRAIYVGDSYDHDVVGARNADMDVALLDREGTAQNVDSPVIPDLWELFNLLK
jgi:HAD superfamily hydrolase (TIGR01662 family)